MKSQKPLSSKKPPEPDESHEIIENWIANTKPALNPIISALDKLIQANLKSPRYAIKWGKAFYGNSDLGWCIEVVAYDVSANIVFLNGSKLATPPELGDETRYVKIRNTEDLESDSLKKWIQESCNTPGWKW